MDKRQRESFFIIADLVLLVIIGFLVYISAKKDFSLRQALAERFGRNTRIVEINKTGITPQGGVYCFIPTGKTVIDKDSLHSLNPGIIPVAGSSILFNSSDGSIFRFNTHDMALTARADNAMTGCSGLKPYGRYFFFMDKAGHFRIFDPLRNEQKDFFTYSSGHAIVDVPEVADINADGVMDLVFPNNGGEVVCLNGRTFAPLWIFSDSADAVLRSPAIANLNDDRYADCVFAAQNGMVYAVDGKSGWVIWKYPVQKEIKGAVYAGDVNSDGMAEIIFVAGKNSLWCLARNGTKIWSMDFPSSISPEISVMDIDADGQKEVLVCRDDREISAVDCLAQDIQWTFPCEGKPLPYSIAFHNSGLSGKKDVIFSDTSGFLYMLSGKTGALLAKARIEDKPVTQTLVKGNSLYFAGASGLIYGFKIIKAEK